METLNNESIPTFENYSMRGILSLNLGQGKHPVYIAEYKTGLPDIALYEPKRVVFDGKEYWDKKFVEIETKEHVYGNGSTLGKLAGQVLGDKNEKVVKKREYNLPLFVTEIVTGTDTFSHHQGPGFWDREPDKITPKEYIKGHPTGVFICLDSFKWESIKYSNDDIFDSYREWLNETGLRR